MYIGIDVGGTFTDAVAIENGTIKCWAKVSTNHESLLECIKDVLAILLRSVSVNEIERVTLSTTMVTNQVVEGREEATDIFVVPGPGASVEGLFPVEPVILKGYTDHRGRVVESTYEGSIQAPMEPNRHGVVSCKFSVRNPQEEIHLGQEARKKGYTNVSEGATLSGTLNFLRRTNSAYYNSAVSDGFARFRKDIVVAIRHMNIDAPIYILKADGGSLPLSHMENRPVETIFTGPAASVLGMSALLTMPKEPTIAIDIGGTTADISLWNEGEPIMARGGVSIKSYATAVRSFMVHSVGIGGDSQVRFIHGDLQVGPKRVGPPMALGGTEPTLGDALIVLGAAKYGKRERSYEGLTSLLLKENSVDSVEALARKIVRKAVAVIIEGIDVAVGQENKKPIYVVEDIIKPHTFLGERLVLVGGTAEVLGPYLGATLQLPYEVPQAASVANAVGAAVARETLQITVRVDTSTRRMVVPELGISKAGVTYDTLEEVISVTESLLYEEAKRMGLAHVGEIEVIDKEDFPTMEGWHTEQHLITVRMQLKVGVMYHVQ